MPGDADRGLHGHAEVERRIVVRLAKRVVCFDSDSAYMMLCLNCTELHMHTHIKVLTMLEPRIAYALDYTGMNLVIHIH